LSHLLKIIFVVLLAGFGSLAQAESILVIGDSLSCGPFGKYLLQDLSKPGNKVTLYCAVSSAPDNWVKGTNPSGQQCKTMTTANPVLQLCGGNGKVPTLASLLAANSGSRVIVGLGTNSLLNAKVDNSYHAMVKAIKASGSQCDWIAPPHLHASQAKGFPPSRIATEEKNLNGFYESLAQTVEGHCNFVDSRDATASGTPGNETVDGVHRNESAGKYWADSIQNTLINSSRPSAAGGKNVR